MTDIRRIRYLEEEIERLQEEKLEALDRAKTDSTLEKLDALDDFLELNNRQTDLEFELLTLKEEDDIED